MKIRSVEPILISVPYRHGGPTPEGDARPWSTMDSLLVKVTTDDNVVGWGEAFGFGGCATTMTAIDTLIAPICVGQSATDIDALGDVLARRLHNFGRNGPVMHAISSLDIALWDIAGKRAGKPLHRMLGAPAADKVAAYASLLRYGDAGLVARNAAEAVQRGYRHVKLHEVTVAAVSAGRKAIGSDVVLTVDTNCPWTVEQAIVMAREMNPLALQWLEEPVWPPEDNAGLARVKEEGGVPVAAGENAATLDDFRRLIGIAKVDYLQPSVTKVGGISGMRRIIALATSAGTAVAPHSPYFGPGLIATLHIIAALVPAAMCERFYCDLEASPFGDQVNARDGFMHVPQGPGLGLEIDETVVARYRKR
jgi:D-galactarolactone cycloisomerase